MGESNSKNRVFRKNKEVRHSFAQEDMQCCLSRTARLKSEWHPCCTATDNAARSV